jgi:hypothetical protein
MIRVYNPKEGRRKGLEITDENNARDYIVVGTDENKAKTDFEKENPNIQVYIKDIEK